MSTLIAWLLGNWKGVAGVIYAMLMAINFAFPFMDANTVATLANIALTLGLGVVHIQQQATHLEMQRSLRTTHDKLDMLAEPFLGIPTDDGNDEPPAPPHPYRPVA